MVIHPKFRDKLFADVIESKGVREYSEMDYLNKKYRDSAVLLSGFYALLIGEWIPRDRIFNFYGKTFKLTPEQIYEKSKLIHFIANWKPWTTSLTSMKAKFPKAPKELFFLRYINYNFRTTFFFQRVIDLKFWL